MEKYIDIKALDLEELVGVVNRYPWFGGARKELCRRMAGMGGDAACGQYADASMYIPYPGKLFRMRRENVGTDWSDSDVEMLLRKYIDNDVHKEERKIYVVGGDYFSQTDYDKVRREEGNVFSQYAVKAKREVQRSEPEDEMSFCTETLAQIYAGQGYYEQAKDIYSKLILAYPEKNAYFAALIQKLEETKE